MIAQKRCKTSGEPPHLIVDNIDKPGELIKISDKKNLRILGANIQPNMGWNNHLESGPKAVLPAIRKQLGQLQMLGKQLPMHSKKSLAEGLLLSKFQYLISQWSGATTTLISKAQVVQNKIARWVTSSNRRTKITTLLQTCGWMSISELGRYHSSIQLWKTIQLNKPEFMSELIQLTELDTVQTNPPRLQFTTNGYRWRATEQWNKLPLQIQRDQKSSSPEKTIEVLDNCPENNGT